MTIVHSTESIESAQTEAQNLYTPPLDQLIYCAAGMQSISETNAATTLAE